MGEAHVTGEIARMAREVQESIGKFAGLEELLRSTLPRLADPSRVGEFNAAVKDLTDRLDESAVHELSMLLSELWLYLNTVEPVSPAVSVRSPSPNEALTSHDRSVLPTIMEVVVNLAAYAGSAAIGGVIGNRTDAGALRLLARVRERWQARRSAPDTPLTRDEAIEVVHSAASFHDYDTRGAELLSAEFRDDGTWLVRLRVNGETLTAVVPPGDPARARVIIRIS